MDRERVKRQTESRMPSGPKPSVAPRRPLTVGRADDPAEREADRLADLVIRRLDAPTPATPSPTAASTRIRRATTVDRLGGAEADPAVVAGIRSRRGHGAPLEPRIARRVGDALGADLSSVRVHTDSASDRLARSLDARAFTIGNDVFVRSEDRAAVRDTRSPLLAHELVHVVQQSGSRIRRFMAPADPAKALRKRNEAEGEQFLDFETLRGWLQEGAAVTGTSDADRRLRNSCQWVLDGRAKIYALTKTGDSDERVTRAGRSPKEYAAYFPQGLAGSPGDIASNARVIYNHNDLDDNQNVEIDDLDTNGWNVPGHVAVVRPRKQGKRKIFELLRHEVQHDADMSSAKRTDALAAGLPGKAALERYKTEYRAYSYEGSKNDKKSMTKTVNRRGYTWTEKQYHIFEHIYDGYPHTKNGWDNDVAVGGGMTFRQAVVAYVDPDSEGYNKYNSGAVRDLYTALQACADREADYMADTAFAVQMAARKLSAEDKTAVVASPDMVALIERKLNDLAYTIVMDIIRPRKR